ncbi:MAG: hypothetical protein H6Q93_792 [Nitrospirae bacterium]|nr:hypothetical protein [Nitrospirota bacterium]
MTVYPACAVAALADIFHRVESSLLFGCIDEKSCCRLTAKCYGEGQAVFILNNRCIAGFRLWVAVNQPEQPDPQPAPEIMRPFGDHIPFGRYDKAVVAGRACRGLEVSSDDPGDVREVPVSFPDLINIAMFAFFIDIIRGNIRVEVALAAGVRFSRNLDREAVPRVAGGASAYTAVRVFPSYSLARPVREDGDGQFTPDIQGSS